MIIADYNCLVPTISMCEVGASPGAGWAGATCWSLHRSRSPSHHRRTI